MKGFSIIVCCYNSAKVIEETLRHLAMLRIPPGYEAEIVLVNNVCTDDTIQLAQETWNALHPAFSLRIVDEENPGLSYARNRGIKTALYDYLLFCDDDNRLSPDYLSVAAAILEQRPEVGALGGLGIPDYEEIPDYWAEDFYIYGSGPQADISGPVLYVHGAGVIIRREAFQKMENADFKFLLTDRKGDQLSSGGDYELCYAIGLAGYVVWYEKALTFRHFITSERLTKEYTNRFIRESAPAIDVLDVYRFYLKNDSPLYGDFYFQQFKLMIYHAYRMYSSYIVRSKYRNDPKMVFLEDFHIQYHRVRIKCIRNSFFKYKHWAREVANFKSRVNHRQHSGEPIGFSPNKQSL